MMQTEIGITATNRQAVVTELTKVLADETVQKWLEGKDPKRIIFVKNKMVNVVV